MNSSDLRALLHFLEMTEVHFEVEIKVASLLNELPFDNARRPRKEIEASPMFNMADLNLILASLQEAAVYREAEVKVAALIDRPSLCDFFIDHKKSCEKEVIFVNDAYPKSEFTCMKSDVGEWTTVTTSFLMSGRVLDFTRCSYIIRPNGRLPRRCPSQALEGRKTCKVHRRLN